ncbi:MAG: DUF2786 domain-containing protein [Candidatus Adiutrix sp.]|nr:DUF2786 domain-containing protein [Candidatus Adiutrix sp.]
MDLRGPCPRPWPDREVERLPERGRRALEKVRKLLALSGSPVEAEAQAALAAAARLMARHNLDLLAEGPGEEAPGGPESRLIALAARRLDRRLALISRILSRHFFVKTIFVPGYDPAGDTENHDLELLGRPENTRLAEHVCRFLLERTETLWREYHRRHQGGGLTARNSFIGGLLEGFARKLAAAARAAGPADGAAEAGGFSALVLAQDRELENFYRRRHPRVVTAGRGGRRRFCPESDRAGRAAGAALNFNRPLENPAGPAPAGPRLLPGGPGRPGERP